MSTVTLPNGVGNALAPTERTNKATVTYVIRNARPDIQQPFKETINTIVSLAPTKDSDITPPEGWTNEEVYLDRSTLWMDDVYQIRDTLSTDYGLHNADPIWARNRKYGEDMFIFRAESGNPRKTAYYVFYAMSYDIYFIDANGLEEIRDIITKTGEGEGYLKGLKLVNLDDNWSEQPE